MRCLPWNLSLLKDKNEKMYPFLLHKFFDSQGIKDADCIADAKEMISPLINRKIEEYPDNDRLIATYEITFTGDNLSLNIASIVSENETKTIAD